MARLARAEIFDPAEIVAVHLIGKTVRSCYLMGVDERSGKNFHHRKVWIEEQLNRLAFTTEPQRGTESFLRSSKFVPFGSLLCAPLCLRGSCR